MKHKISRISLMLVTTVLFTIFSSSVVSAATLNYSTSLTRMHKLGIISSSVTNTNSVVTRQSFLKSIIASEGLGAAAESSKGTTPFSDIAANSTLSGYINAGLSIGTTQGVYEGVVYGTSDGSYKPNSALTYAEACTIMVRLLGYSDTDSVLSNTSWPNNYIQEAATLKLTTGISSNKSSALTVGVEAVLFDRLFDSTMKASSSTYFSDTYYGDTASASGTLTEAIVFGNSKTSDNLAGNQILTDKGTYTLQTGVTTPEVGGKYKLYVDNGTVTKVATEENSVDSYVVKSISTDDLISYTANNATKTLTLPKLSAYYYHGAYVDYATAVKSVYVSSSIILAKNNNGSGYAYGIIVDPSSDDTVVTGTLTDAIILGNSKTSSALSDNQILAEIGTATKTLTLKSGVTAPDVGGKYELYYVADSLTVTKIVVKENTLEDYAVTAVSSATKLVSYTDDNNKTETITLPQASAYYHNGVIVDYAAALKAVQCYSSIVLAKSSDGSGYDYGIIVDPCFGQPYVYKYDNVELLNKLNDTKYDYMYREVSNLASKVGNITKDDLSAYDVVYFVSDIWSKHTFVYAYNKSVIGTISAFIPNKSSPTGLTISSTDYSFSSYFDKTKLNSYDGATGNWLTSTNVGDLKHLILGIDGTIVDMY